MELYTRDKLMRSIFMALALLISTCARAQADFDIKLAGNKSTYSLNEIVVLELNLAEQQFEKLKGQKVIIESSEEGNAARGFHEYIIKGKKTTIKIPGASTPQIMRIKTSITMDGKPVSKYLGVNFAGEKLVATSKRPGDFKNFWEGQLNTLKDLPLKANMKLVEEWSTDSINVYLVDYQVDQSSSRFYGVLNVPKFGPEGTKYPAIVIYPGAGVRGYGYERRYAKNGIISFQVGIHGLPINLPNETYTSLAQGALSGYPYFNIQSREQYYFNRVVKGAIRALDFIQSLDEYDQKNLFVNGSSQGGALSLMVTALDKRVNAVAAYCPALCQTNGTSYGKAEGWPKPTVRFGNSKLGMAADVEKTIAYYDVCNFVEDIGVPIFMTWGLIDDVTPASTIFGAYNRISAPKNNLLMPNIAHANDRSQIDAVHDFIFKSVR